MASANDSKDIKEERNDLELQLNRKMQELFHTSSRSSSRYEKAKEILEFLSRKQMRKPAVVVQVGQDLLKNCTKRLGDEVWDYYELVFIAALDCDYAQAKTECLRALTTKFPRSIRVEKLIALQAESVGDYREAQKIYDKILNEDPSNMSVWKRRICIMKAQNLILPAIKELTRYCELFSSDAAGWEELSELYISIEKYELAKFCMEELLLLLPENYLYHLQYAQLLYTLGGKANIELARQYYAQSLELKPENNLRALYGLILCLKGRTGSKSQLTQLYEWGIYKLSDQYRHSLSKHHPLFVVVNELFKLG